MPDESTPEDYAAACRAALEDHFTCLLASHVKEYFALRTRDNAIVGRILTSHLLVESYLERYLRAAFPAIPLLDKVRLQFLDKWYLASNPRLTGLVRWSDGVLRLNQVRNKLSHDLAYAPTLNDVEGIRKVLEVFCGSARDDSVECIELLSAHVCTSLGMAVEAIGRHGSGRGITGLLEYIDHETEAAPDGLNLPVDVYYLAYA